MGEFREKQDLRTLAQQNKGQLIIYLFFKRKNFFDIANTNAVTMIKEGEEKLFLENQMRKVCLLY